MKTSLFLLLLTFTLNAIGADFHCRYLRNLSLMFENDVTIAPGAKEVVIAEVEEYRYFLSSLGGRKFELQALNLIEPSRTYALSNLGPDSPSMSLVIWKREQIVEVSCTLR